MFKEKRGQSALEYLMTYGWALIVIVIVIAALVFLINPTQIGAGNCTGFQKLPIRTFQMSNEGLSMVITNMTGETISNVNFQASFNGEVYVPSLEYTGSQSINANAETTVSWTGQSLSAGSQSIDLNVTYWDGYYTRPATATCKGTIQ